MTIHTPFPETRVIEDPSSIWGLDLTPAGCPGCKRTFLLPAAKAGRTCPVCGRSQLAPQPALLRREAPEMWLPFRRKPTDLVTAFAEFTHGIWFAPADLTAANLAVRALPVYYPLWLVDCAVAGDWQAEIGFDYQVKSSEDTYQNNEWRSRPVVETRIRWEPRLGQICRKYQNTTAPAVSDYSRVAQRLGAYPFEQSVPYDPSKLNGAIISLPDIPPEGAWSYARSRVERLASDEICKAAGGQHVRNFAIHPQYSEQNWTQLLLPIYATYYTDDENRTQLIWVNGVTGVVSGPRLASQKKGWMWAGILGGVAGLAFLISLILLLAGAALPPLAVVGTIGIIFALLLGAAAIIPAVIPWQWNRRQQSEKWNE